MVVGGLLKGCGLVILPLYFNEEKFKYELPTVVLKLNDDDNNRD